jgi:hypothetical protein
MDLASLVITAVIAGGGAYLGSYLKKKGENWATKEDLKQLVDQMSAVTHATKTIEARISTDIWYTQRMWELRKEALFQMLNEISNVYALLHKALTSSGPLDQPISGED